MVTIAFEHDLFTSLFWGYPYTKFEVSSIAYRELCHGQK